MERRNQVERSIDSTKPIEHRAEPPSRGRAGKRKPEREKQKTNSGHDNGGRYPFAECIQLAVRPAEKRRANEKQVDRHVRQNEKRDEWNCDFPPKENGAD